MTKKIIYLTMLISILISNLGLTYAELSSGDILAESAILIDADTNQILYSKNMHTPLKPASTTKVLTALLILEKFELTDEVVIDKKSPFTDGSRIYIIEGEVFTVEQLLNAMLVESANDVASALAIYHSGSIKAFADAMNARAKELGALNSNFENPNGLDSDKHVSTAYDLALIAKEAMKNETFRSIVKKSSYQIPPTNKQPETRNMTNSNKFLYATGSSNKIDYKGKSIDIKYDVVTGIKTGYTNAAGQCFISSASKDGQNLISVILKSQGKNIYIDTRTLLDYGFDNFQRIVVAKAGEALSTITIDGKDVSAVLKNDLNLLMPSDFDKTLIEKTIVNTEALALPIDETTVLASVEYTYNGQSLAKEDLYAPFEMSNKELLGKETEVVEKNSIDLSASSIIFFIIKLLLSLILWRFIMTIINIMKLRLGKK